MKKGEGKVYSGKVETRKTMGVEITGVFLFPPEGRDQSKKIESDDKNKKGKNDENRSDEKRQTKNRDSYNCKNRSRKTNAAPIN